jgi:hypothetical protein
VSGGAWRLQQPDAHVVALRWTEQHPPETFSFWNCRLRVPAADPAAAIVPAELPALIYHPHPDTKRAHHQPQGCLEVLAPWLGTLADGQTLELGVEPRRCRLIHPARLRARLLEFLKFRVLAAQEEFFIAFQGDGDNAPADAERVRRWLRPLWPEALDLSDADLQATLAQARHLYVN